jgi:hypothetical protein
MTKNPDRAEVALRDALERRAADAPRPGELIERVRERRQRRRWRTAGPAVLAAAAVVVVLAVAAWPGGRGGTGPAPGPKPEPAASSNSSNSSNSSDAAAAGWRWESYGGIEVQVPGAWTDGITGSPPCLVDQEGKRPAPYVGRPGAVPAIGCAKPVPELPNRSPYVWLGDSGAKPGSQDHGHGWVTETRDVHGVLITVFAADAALRERILGSARRIGKTDTYGCQPDDPNSSQPEARPKPGTALADVGNVEQIAICTYAIDSRADAGLPSIASSRLTGQAAQAAVDAILAAPAGSGPNDRGSCATDYAYGDQITVLHVRGDQATADVIVRYSGCDHHGTDDGEIVRQLTKDVAQRVITGPHKPSGLIGSVADLIWDKGPATPNKPK